MAGRTNPFLIGGTKRWYRDRHVETFAEPWFLAFNAKVTMHPAMTPADLGAAGLEAIAKAW